MNKLNCFNCVFGGLCGRQNLLECCEYYCPINEDSDEMIDEYIEERRRGFTKEWFQYVGENYYN